MVEIIKIIIEFVLAAIIVWRMVAMSKIERTNKKPIAKFNIVSRQQFRKDWANTINAPTDCEDAWVVADKIYDNLKLPIRATKGSAGYDFYSPIDFALMPNQSIMFPTGICAEIADNWVLQIYPRSSLGIKGDTELKNYVGIVDSDYSLSDNEGHIFCVLKNNGLKPLRVNAGDRLLQGIFVPYGITYDDNTEKERNGGFGSSGR